MNMQFPRIVEFSTTERFSYLWMKYINGFDLNVHCARCLLGEYSKIFPYGKAVRYLNNEVLNEYGAKYYYICGVTKPYRWKDNLHIAFRYKEGSGFIYNDGRTRLVMDNAEQIIIREQKEYRIQFGDLAAYNTCRNWRFAYQMTFVSE